VALGNLEERIWSKSDRFAPVLHQDFLCFLTSLAVGKCCPLQQRDCKNMFCHGILPSKETTIVCPPSGDPDADPQKHWLLLKMLYGLRRSSHHWYDKINAILISIGLKPSLKDPYLSTLVLFRILLTLHRQNLLHLLPLASMLMTSFTSLKTLQSKLYYVVSCLSDVKWMSWAWLNGSWAFILFCASRPPQSQFIPINRVLLPILLRASFKVDGMGVVEWFLGIHFTLRIPSTSVSVHLNQSGFAANLVESFFEESHNVTPTGSFH